MYEKIYQKLVNGLKNSPLSDRTIASKAQRLAKKITTEEQMTDEVINDAIEDLKELGGQINNEVATKVKEQIDKFNSKQPATPSTPTPTSPAPDKGESDLAAKIANLEAILSQSLQEQKRSRIIDDVRREMLAKNANNEYILNNILSKVTISDGESVEQIAARCISSYDEDFRKAFGQGAQPRNADTGGQVDKEEAIKSLQDFAKRMNEGNV